MLIVLATAINIGMHLWKSQGPARTCLTFEGVMDISGGKTTILPWHRVKTVRLHHGDVHFWSSGMAVIWVPRGAFPDLEAARQFAAAGLMAMQGNALMLSQTSMPTDAPHEPGVWPPPPSSSHLVPSSKISNAALDFDWNQWLATEKRLSRNVSSNCVASVFSLSL